MSGLLMHDPVMDGSNWYGYCSNNPLKYVDPSGLFDMSTLADGVADKVRANRVMNDHKGSSDIPIVGKRVESHVPELQPPETIQDNPSKFVTGEVHANDNPNIVGVNYEANFTITANRKGKTVDGIGIQPHLTGEAYLNGIEMGANVDGVVGGLHLEHTMFRSDFFDVGVSGDLKLITGSLGFGFVEGIPHYKATISALEASGNIDLRINPINTDFQGSLYGSLLTAGGAISIRNGFMYKKNLGLYGGGFRLSAQNDDCHVKARTKNKAR